MVGCQPAIVFARRGPYCWIVIESTAPVPQRPNDFLDAHGNFGGFFTFIFFIFVFYKNIFSILQFTVLYPYRPQGGGRDLFLNKKNYLRGRSWQESAAPLPGGRPPAATPLGGRGAAGSPAKLLWPLDVF